MGLDLLLHLVDVEVAHNNQTLVGRFVPACRNRAGSVRKIAQILLRADDVAVWHTSNREEVFERLLHIGPLCGVARTHLSTITPRSLIDLLTVHSDKVGPVVQNNSNESTMLSARKGARRHHNIGLFDSGLH